MPSICKFAFSWLNQLVLHIRTTHPKLTLAGNLIRGILTGNFVLDNWTYMKISLVAIRNFRRLEDVQFSLEDDHTVFVGPNNSGKTSAAAAFQLFFKRSEFTINDFTVACIGDFDKFGEDLTAPATTLPAIEMDLWLTITPDIEYGRVSSLLPDGQTDYKKVGIRLRFCVKDADLLRAEYESAFPLIQNKERKKLAQFLSLPKMLSRHFGVRYFTLATENKNTKHTEIKPDEGQRTLTSLIRVDFIDAQRNIDDQNSGRSTRLSDAFSAYYKHNLKQAAVNEEANKVIDENNSKLTAHYQTHFAPLFGTIASLGVPAAHDRTLRIVSSLSPQEALQGNTTLYYVDEGLKHELPEAYNGLGFKNLVYLAIQICHFHAQWLLTENSRELCQLIFIEEPEVHLHAQVQQIFISNIWAILAETAKAEGEENAVPQLTISTHSSHILDTVEFDKVRYFRRCAMKCQAGTTISALNATRVLSLKDFQPTVETPPITTKKKKTKPDTINDELNQKNTLNFLKKYLKLTHCDLFFADAAILIEGTAEKLLMTEMIDKCAKGLQSRYLTILEVGGAYAHKLASLLDFLGIPYLVITDIDTVDSKDGRKACRADQSDANTSNAALKLFLVKDTRADLVAILPAEHIVAKGEGFITFQMPVTVVMNDGSKHPMHGRTLEEAFIYENLSLFQKGELELGIDFAKLGDAEAIKENIYATVINQNFKKTEFALGIAASAAAWRTPAYIKEGLQWLERKLAPPKPSRVPADTAVKVSV
jgi:putative ATP-dependent endonuclease of the OLD family